MEHTKYLSNRQILENTFIVSSTVCIFSSFRQNLWNLYENICYDSFTIGIWFDFSLNRTFIIPKHTKENGTKIVIATYKLLIMGSVICKIQGKTWEDVFCCILLHLTDKPKIFLPYSTGILSQQYCKYLLERTFI